MALDAVFRIPGGLSMTHEIAAHDGGGMTAR
jgi:hypothetical protein